jgi:hypothetical protein
MVKASYRCIAYILMTEKLGGNLLQIDRITSFILMRATSEDKQFQAHCSKCALLYVNISCL